MKAVEPRCFAIYRIVYKSEFEKRLARYPQVYARIGFVHEFRPLCAAEIRQLLAQGWISPGAHRPEQPWAAEAIAAIIKITGGNFRLLSRLLTQMERILKINELHHMRSPRQ